MASVAVSATGPGDVGRELVELAEHLRELPRTVVDEAAPAARDAILDDVRGRRGTLSMSGLGVTLDVHVRTEGGRERAEAHLEATPAGAWTIADDGTRAHHIRGARGMPTPYGVFDAVDHPGARGVRAWDGAVARAERETDEIVDDALDRLGD